MQHHAAPPRRHSDSGNTLDRIAKRPVFRQSLQPPSLRLVLRDRAARRAIFRYWVKDPCNGGVDYGVHYGLRLMRNIDLCSRIGGALGRRAGHKFYRSHAERARRNLAKLQPRMTEDQLDAAIASMYDGIGRAMTEFSVLERLIPAGRVDIVGSEHLAAARRGGRGVVVAGIHLGNWELASAAMFHLNPEAKGFYEPPTNRFRHALAYRSRARYGARALRPNQGTALQMVRHLKDAGTCIIYVDEAYRGTIYGPRLGRQRALAGNIVIAARYSALTGADIVPVHCERLDGANFRVIFHAPLPAPAAAAGRTTDDIVAEAAERLESLVGSLIKDRAAQWYYLGELDLD